MQRIGLVGVACTLIGLIGYALAVVEPYPGRELTLILILVGVTMAAVGGAIS